MTNRVTLNNTELDHENTWKSENLINCLNKFDGEDVFAEVETGKVLASWRLNLDKDGDVSVIRGIDVLEFQGNKLAKKLAYMKVDKPHLETD